MDGILWDKNHIYKNEIDFRLDTLVVPETMTHTNFIYEFYVSAESMRLITAAFPFTC
jgi:hypothetical protein